MHIECFCGKIGIRNPNSRFLELAFYSEFVIQSVATQSDLTGFVTIHCLNRIKIDTVDAWPVRTRVL